MRLACGKTRIGTSLPPMWLGVEWFGVDAICGLSLLLVSFSALRGFTLGSLLSLETNFPNSNLIWEVSPDSWRHEEDHRFISTLNCVVSPSLNNVRLFFFCGGRGGGGVLKKSLWRAVGRKCFVELKMIFFKLQRGGKLVWTDPSTVWSILCLTKFH